MTAEEETMAKTDIQSNESGHWWCGNGFFKLEHTHRWYIGLWSVLFGAFGVLCFIVGAYFYDLAVIHTDPNLVWAIPLSSLGILIFFSVMSWASFNLSQALQNYRNYSAPMLRFNAIYTAFVGLLYATLSMLQMGRPLVFLDNLSPTTPMFMMPLVILIILKIYVAAFLQKRFGLNLSKSMIAFWLVFIATAIAMFYDGMTHPDYDQLFNWRTIVLAIMTGIGACNLLFSYSSATMTLKKNSIA